MQSFEWTGTYVLENDPCWNHDSDFGSGICGADNRQFAPDAEGPLTHSLQAKVSVSASVCDGGIDAYTIVAHAQAEIPRIT